MSKIKIAIVEDEMLIANDIHDALEDMGYAPLEPCVSYGEAMELLKTESPDLALLDIQLAGSKDGIDVAQVLKRSHNIPFVFLTSDTSKSALERAKILDPAAYLSKPFRPQDLFASIEMALHNFNGRNHPETPKSLISDSLFLKQNNLFHRIRYNDISYVKSDHVYLEIYTLSGQKFLYRSTVADFLKEVPANGLVQVQRSYLINPLHISAISATTVFLGKAEVPIGLKYRDEFMNRMDLG